MSRPRNLTRDVLDGPKIRQLRLAAGMSELALVDAVGIGWPTLRLIEARGGGRRAAASISLNQLSLIADTLAVPIQSLFLDNPGVQPADTHDPRALGALLQHVGKSVLPEEAAQALDWTLDRLLRAADNLALALPLVGLRLRRTLDGKLSVVSETNGTSRADAIAAGISRDARSMNESEALLLYAITGRTLSPKTMNNARRVAYAGLLKHRLITEDDDCNPEAGPAVAYAFDF
ncbi:MAG: family transcriptional regulator [Frankiales bacterium]|jgi:transcriptional regulator with XRE-family HTH domain|nr:family transcriptional regulator [Frankiales bacterium]